MTLGTTADYHSVAARLAFEGRAFIAGRFTAAAGGEAMETSNPATGQVLAAVASGQAADIDCAVAAAPGLSAMVRGRGRRPNSARPCF
jgi:hypothetical protein